MTKMLRFIAAVGVCLVAAVLVLALCVRQPQESFAAALGDILHTVWTRVLLPGRGIDHQVNYRNWVNSLLAATPILLTGLAVTVAFRAAVWNIGAQGQYLAGAIVAAALGIYLPGPVIAAAAAARGIYLPSPGIVVIPLLLVAAMAGGALIAAIAAALERWRGVSVVLSTLMLNFIVWELLRFLLMGALRGAGGQPQSEQVAVAARLPLLGHTRLHIGFLFALVVAVGVSWLIRSTTFGLRLRAVGENPVAARFTAINVPRVAMAALCLSGALAGLAGGIQISGVLPYQLLLDTGSSGFGFTGIAAALLGALEPLGVVAAALLLGVLDTAFAALEIQRNVPYVTAQAMQGAILIAVLILTRPWKKNA